MKKIIFTSILIISLCIVSYFIYGCEKEKVPVYDTAWTINSISIDGTNWIDISRLPDKYQGTIKFASNTHSYITTGFFGNYEDRFVDNEQGRNLYFGSYLYMTIIIVGREQGIETRITLRGGTTFYIRFI